MTTDGTITDIPRSAYIPAEERVVDELKKIGKPFIVVLNSANPEGSAARSLKNELSEKYGVSCLAVNCLSLDEPDVEEILKTVLLEFPIARLGLFLPPWLEALPPEHPIKSGRFSLIREACMDMFKLRDAAATVSKIGSAENIQRAAIREIKAGSGTVLAEAELPRELFYSTLSERSGFTVSDDGDLLKLLTDMSGIKSEYDKVRDALRDVREKGYGIVYPTKEELKLCEPEIVRHGGRYGVRLKASAPSIHMILANIETEVSPALGSERHSEDIINYLLQEFEGDTGKIWESNIFGKSLYDIAGEGLQTKIKSMPEDAQGKLQETLQRIVNEGSAGLICILF
jgi:stage IV sporulation protein A